MQLSTKSSPKAVAVFSFKLAAETLMALARAQVLGPDEITTILGRGVMEARRIATNEPDVGADVERLFMALSDLIQAERRTPQ